MNKNNENNTSTKLSAGLVPKLRFPEFTNDGEWEKKALNKLGKLVNGLTYSPDDVKEEGLLVLRSSNIRNGVIVLDDNVYVRTDVKGANLSEPNDILICVRNGSKALIGKNALIPTGMPLCTHGAFMIVFRSDKSKFIFQLFQTKAYATKVAGDLGATINSINGSNFLKYEFLVPKNPEEQQKIADCLSSLDEVITTENQKLEVLKDHKKGLLQNLFPQEGETVPKLRFKEFENSGEWEIKKLGNICDVRDGTHDSPKYVSQGYPLITSKNLMSNGTMDFTDVNYLTEYDYNQINKRSKVDVGDILFGMIGTIGNPVVVKTEGFAIKNVALIKSQGGLNQEFLVYQLKSDFIEKQFKRMNAGGILKFIALGIIRNLDIIVTNNKEQEKIATCLSSLDEIISAQSQKIEALKLHKKGLLQGLFPGVNET